MFTSHSSKEITVAVHLAGSQNLARVKNAVRIEIREWNMRLRVLETLVLVQDLEG